jgi:hypothetical protein
MNGNGEEVHVLERIAREMKSLRELMQKFVYAMVDQAEAEVPESMRRFVTYMHDMHDITYMYEQRGLPIPNWILRELERSDDRLRQLLEKHHTGGGAFEKVRREMAEDVENRWDHTRLLYPPKEKKDATRTS